MAALIQALMAFSHLPLWRGRLLTLQDQLCAPEDPCLKNRASASRILMLCPYVGTAWWLALLSEAAASSLALAPSISTAPNLMCILRLGSMLQCQELQQAWLKPAVTQSTIQRGTLRLSCAAQDVALSNSSRRPTMLPSTSECIK